METSFKREVPSHEKQKEIAEGFGAMSGAGFKNVIGAINGLIICILCPPMAICRLIQCGQANFKCHRKDKFGLNMQTICDNKLHFWWVEIKWPGATSDFMAWTTSLLCKKLDDNDHLKLLCKSYTLVGDLAYVKRKYMAIPLKGYRHGHEDAYNFYLSQL